MPRCDKKKSERALWQPQHVEFQLSVSCLVLPHVCAFVLQITYSWGIYERTPANCHPNWSLLLGLFRVPSSIELESDWCFVPTRPSKQKMLITYRRITAVMFFLFVVLPVKLDGKSALYTTRNSFTQIKNVDNDLLAYQYFISDQKWLKYFKKSLNSRQIYAPL